MVMHFSFFFIKRDSPRQGAKTKIHKLFSKSIIIPNLTERDLIKMDVSQLFTLIGSYGFPIVMCLVLMWFIMKVLKEFSKTLSDLKLSTDKNSELIQRLIDKIDRDA